MSMRWKIKAGLKKVLPRGAVSLACNVRASLRPVERTIDGSMSEPIRRVELDNVLHRSTWKAGSAWLGRVLADLDFYAYSGLERHLFAAWRDRLVTTAECQGMSPTDVEKALLKGHEVALALPRNVIGASFYLSFGAYRSIPKPPRHKAFLVLRDPRDLVVSWYFSALKSHPEKEIVGPERKLLQELSKNEGLHHVVDSLAELAVFSAQRSWVEGARTDSTCRIFRLEDLARDHSGFLHELLAWLGVDMPDDAFSRLCDRYASARPTGDRKQGTSDDSHHLRKGGPGDWKNHFDESLVRHLADTSGDVLETLGYA